MEKLITKSFQRLLDKGIHRGFITYDELSNSLGKRSASRENFEKAFLYIFDNKVSLVEKKSDYQVTKKREATATDEEKAQKEIVLALAAAHNGVYRMSPEITGLVEASNNIANVTIKDGKAEIKCLTRSSVESSKDDLAASLRAAFELAGFDVSLSGEYPGWAPNRDSAILKTLDGIYQDMFHEQADIAACHAGLECGIIGSHYPKLDMISFGPTIRGAHSPDERASISSSQKYWKFLLEVLKNIPEN